MVIILQTIFDHFFCVQLNSYWVVLKPLGGVLIRDLLVLFHSLLFRALFPRVLRSRFARIAAYKEYSIFFEDHADGVYCVVRTWDENELQKICVRVESLEQQVPRAELSS